MSWVAVGVAGAAVVGGVIAGASDDPDQNQFTNQTTNQSSTTSNQLGALTAEQQQLQEQSLQQYLQQMALAQQYDQGIGGAQQYQDLARQQAMGIAGGSAFQLTPQEQQFIDQQRQAQIDQSTFDVNKLLDQRMGQIGQGAGERGLRGQAVGELQGRALQAGAEQLGSATRAAAATSAQQAQNLPYQRLAAQAPYIQQGATLADQMRVQAQTNRNLAQSPYLLQLLNQNRIAGATQTSNGTSNTYGTNLQPGAQGSFLRGLSGGLQAAGGGVNSGVAAAGTVQNMNAPKLSAPTGGTGGGFNYTSSQPYGLT